MNIFKSVHKTHTIAAGGDVEDSVEKESLDDVAIVEEDGLLPSESSTSSIFDRPIVVGYAFGPKKMSTMGVVMAEASKAKLSANPTTKTWTDDDERDIATTTTTAAKYQDNTTITDNYNNNNNILDDEEYSVKNFSSPPPKTTTTTNNNHQEEETKVKHFVFSVDLDTGKSLSKKKNDNNNNNNDVGLQNIVRYFRSSCCSSVGSVVSTGINTACSTSVTSTTTTTIYNNNNNNNINKNNNESSIPVRVSFVPLDPDMPLEDQHGGKIDVVLHKLTEDILCLSKMNIADATTSISTCNDDNSNKAIQRVQRLVDFQRDHPECSLVDNPMAVQTLMSRAAIAVTLQKCLQTVQTTSGIPVRSPKYAVIHNIMDNDDYNFCSQLQDLKFPIIVKPLTAAGTKASHAMAVVLDRNCTSSTIPIQTPCLCQEYCNHDAVLYKVYVLGDHVSVHKRRSLPNLPSDQTSTKQYVEFDSQRPYPRLEDFGFINNNNNDKVESTTTTTTNRKRPWNRITTSTITTNQKVLIVTIEEVKPIVNALKNAFGLQLFGFDILVEEEKLSSSRRKILVVDVNYFPSYKEVHNFPILLAKYLTHRAIENRKRALLTTKKKKKKKEQLYKKQIIDETSF